jgi:cyclopropane-fatty-acyl-phospholipid synthase
MELENAERRMPAAPATASLATQWLLGVLGRLRHGRLTVHAGGGSHLFLGDRSGPAASLSIRRPWRLAARLLGRGDLGLAEGFIAGDWDAPHPAQVLEVLAINEPHLLASGAGRLSRWIDRLQHRRRHNDRRGSRRNIAFHYDLGNDFYRLWLDPGMTYSAALFAASGEPLEAAQTRKYQRILDRLGASPGQHILEIGCGWGGFAEHAARQGYRVTGITLSREQLAHARERVAAAGLAERVELRLQDYRDLTGTYDHVVSIEMFEAVGEQYWAAYFDTLRRLLAPGGRASLQVITIDADCFEPYRRGTDFIQKYVFPGGMLPSVPAFDAAARDAGLGVVDRAFHGLDYADTLRRWDAAFCAGRERVASLGFDERFLRLWRYYLGYCEAGFRTGRIDLMQVALAPG